GDVVKVIRKEFLYYTVDKNGSIGKVPKGKLREHAGGGFSTQTQLNNISQPNALQSSSNSSPRNIDQQLPQGQTSSTPPNPGIVESQTKYLNVKKGDCVTSSSQSTTGWLFCKKDGKSGLY
ncbi:MAG: hypothetical protein EZS28_054664, partial [Streblomastix strix]